MHHCQCCVCVIVLTFRILVFFAPNRRAQVRSPACPLLYVHVCTLLFEPPFYVDLIATTSSTETSGFACRLLLHHSSKAFLEFLDLRRRTFGTDTLRLRLRFGDTPGESINNYLEAKTMSLYLRKHGIVADSKLIKGEFLFAAGSLLAVMSRSYILKVSLGPPRPRVG